MLQSFAMREQDSQPLKKICSVCGTTDNVEIETVTNVMPQPEDMFPVLLCKPHKKALQDRTLDITLDEKKNLCFVVKKKSV
jgi:hypothetical protein